jgi:chromosome segregation ATPase
MNGKIKLITFLFLLFSINLWASIAPANPMLTQTKKKLLEAESKLKEISSSIENLESTLGKKNNQYLEIGKQKEINQKNIEGIRSQLLKGEQNLKYRKAKAGSELRALIMGQLDEGSSSGNLLVNKVLMRELNAELKQIESELAYNQKLQENLDLESEKLQKYESTQEQLLSVMDEMEAKKLALANEFVQTQENKKQINEKYFKLIASSPKVINPAKERLDAKVAVNNLGINFFPPVSSPRNVNRALKFLLLKKEKLFILELYRLLEMW